MLSSLSLANDGFLPRGIIAPLAYLSNGYLFNDRVLIPTLFRGLDSGFAANLYGSGYKNDTMSVSFKGTTVNIIGDINQL